MAGVFVHLSHALLLWALFQWHEVQSHKILILPMYGNSHYFVMRKIAGELAQRDNEVVMVVGSSQRQKPSTKITHIQFDDHERDEGKEILEKLVKEKMHPLTFLSTQQAEYCDLILGNSELLTKIKDPDIIIGDSLFGLCTSLLSEKLGVRRIDINMAFRTPLAFMYNIPQPVSYIPQGLSTYTPKMSFIQRVVNTLSYLALQVFTKVYYQPPFERLRSKYKICPEQGLEELAGKAEMVLCQADFALEYSQPLLPGTVMVGAILPEPAKPLAEDLEKFMSSSEHGVVLVSFGSMLDTITKETVAKLAQAFGGVKQNVLWKLKGYIPPNLSPNIKTVSWLPQNDILGHPKIKAFVSHMGQNGVYESTYHGVPMVGVPVFADQCINTAKVEYKGAGLAADYQSNTALEIQHKIERVVNEPKFKERALRISRLLKDRRRTPAQEAADWMEYVLRHNGVPHLRPEVFNLAWYQYFLVDVFALLLAVAVSAGLIIRFTCRLICRLCKCGGKGKMKGE